MQYTSALYDQIVASPNHWFEVMVRFFTSDRSHLDVPQNQIFSISTYDSAFSDNVPQIGCAVSGEVDLEIIAPQETLRPMCPFRLFIIARTENERAEIIRGDYYIDTREISHNDDGLDVMKIHGYDAMLKFEQMYPSDDTHDYPLVDTEIVQFMCDTIGIQVDQRTTHAMNRAYEFTPFGYTMREMLGYIASAYGGNFIISDCRELLLVPLGGLRTETYYLVTEGGDSITFGGNRILV